MDFMVAYDRHLGDLRTSLQTEGTLFAKSGGNIDAATRRMLMRLEKENEIIETCNDALTLLQQHLIPFVKEDDAKILYFTMEGDFQRYIAECEVGDARSKLADAALESYTKASQLAAEKLEATHELRLRVAMKLSTFYFETLGDRAKGRQVAKEAHDGASAVFNDPGYKGSYRRDQHFAMDWLKKGSTHLQARNVFRQQKR
ncbi:hypothetical protein MBANPS3_000696 [Mucor bainieri]